MCPASTPPTVTFRWTDAEHDILAAETNKQLELEAQDKSFVIPWAKHWQRVSSSLQENGYIRTPSACAGYWKRTIDAQKADEEAAGPGWSDSEHEILLSMTEDQIDAEKANPAFMLTWPQHWKQVSLRMKERGYTRSIDMCAAYWRMLETNSQLITARGSARAEAESIEVQAEIDHDSDGEKERPRKSSKIQQWTESEHHNLARLLKERRDFEERHDEDELSGAKLWMLIARTHQQSGYNRTWEACKRHWHAYERSQSRRSKPGIICPYRASVSDDESETSFSRMFAPVVDSEDEPLVVEEPTSTGCAGTVAPSQIPQSNTRASNSDPLTDSAKQAVLSDSDSSEIIYAQRGKKNSASSKGSNQLSDQSPAGQPKSKTTRFRFDAHQKAILDAEVEMNGPYPGVQRKLELANLLGVEENSIRNWFVHFRQLSNKRYSHDSYAREEVSFTSNTMNSFSTNAQSLRESNTKRRRDSPDTSEAVSVTKNPQSNMQSSKKPRLDAELDLLQANPTPVGEAARMNAPTSPMIEKVGASPREASGMFFVFSAISGVPKATGERVQSNPPLPSPIISTPGMTAITKEAEPKILPTMEQPKLGPPPPPSHLILPSSAREQSTTDSPPLPRPTQDNLNSGPPPPPHHPAKELPTSHPSPAPNSPSYSIPTSGTKPDIPSVSTTVSTEQSQNHQGGIDKTDDVHTSSSATTGSATTLPPTQALPAIERDSKEWALSELQKFRSEIGDLEQSIGPHEAAANQIEREINDTKTAHVALHHKKDEAIARLMQLIEQVKERFTQEHDALLKKQEALKGDQESKLQILNKTKFEVARKKAGLSAYQAVVDYYESLDDAA